VPASGTEGIEGREALKIWEFFKEEGDVEERSRTRRRHVSKEHRSLSEGGHSACDGQQ